MDMSLGVKRFYLFFVEFSLGENILSVSTFSESQACSLTKYIFKIDQESGASKQIWVYLFLSFFKICQYK